MSINMYVAGWPACVYWRSRGIMHGTPNGRCAENVLCAFKSVKEAKEYCAMQKKRDKEVSKGMQVYVLVPVKTTQKRGRK
jgi:hypothetical protein